MLGAEDRRTLDGARLEVQRFALGSRCLTPYAVRLAMRNAAVRLADATISGELASVAERARELARAAAEFRAHRWPLWAGFDRNRIPAQATDTEALLFVAMKWAVLPRSERGFRRIIE